MIRTLDLQLLDNIICMRDHFVRKLSELAEKNKKIILLTGDLGFGVLDDFAKQLPHQFVNVGIAEQNLTGIATGLSLDNNRITFTYSIGNFNTLRCLEQIRNDACYHEANVNIVSVGGGFSYGALGYSHHATEDIAIMRALPNIRIFCPCDFWEVQQITEKVVELGGVNYIRIDKSSAGNTQIKDEIFTVGKGRILSSGDDVTIISTGGITEVALEASKELRASNIHSTVVSMHTIKPIDEELIKELAQKTKILVTLEEHTVIGGLGSAVSEVLMNSQIFPKKFKSIGLSSKFSTIVGSQTYLRKVNNLDTISVVNAIKDFI